MKKHLTAFMCLLLVLSLCACVSSNPTETQTGSGSTEDFVSGGVFQVGFGRVDITPEESVPIAGAGNTSSRMSEGYLDYIYTTCIAFTDPENNTVLLFHNDLIRSEGTLSTEARNAISEKTGIPFDNILISATHTHNAPDPDNIAEPSIARYRTSLVKWMLNAAEIALLERKPATMSIGVTYPEGLNFIRHYTTESGAVKGDNFGDEIDSPYTGHTHTADNALQLIRFTRQDAQDIVLVNWQSHPHRASGKSTGFHYEISADIVGSMRSRFEGKTDCLFAYFTGASGNVNPTSRITEENITANYVEQGETLADYAIAALDSMEPAQTGTIQILSETYTGIVDHTEDHKVANARVVAAEWAANNNMTAAIKLAQQYEMNSPYHAQGIISKASMPDTYDVPMNAFSIGSVSFITAPYEMFDTNGKYIREQSPFQMTFIVTCANYALGYIPSSDGFSYNAYNSYEANTGKFVPGTGDILAEKYVALLEQVHESGR